MVTVKIDGIEVTVPAGSTILDAAKEAGVHIPVLCHDKRLNPFGACRVCLTEVVGNPKLMTACTTPVNPGMEVITQNEKLQKLRRTVVELLLINHPLDCPSCDKGGECTLQDLTFETGLMKVRFDAKPADTPVDHTNPFIERDIDRCVLCGRCVRICDEVVNVEAISFLNRGTETMIGTAFEQPWNCEYCGQCISVCPVGSLNNRVYLFKNRPWNMEQVDTVCGLCSCGCSLTVESEDNEVYRVSDNQEGVNHGYLCAKGRFGFELINSVDRPQSPMVKKDGELKQASLEEAVAFTSEKLKTFKADEVGVLVSPRLTNEEAFIAKKYANTVLNTKNVFSLESDVFAPEASYTDVENADAVLVLNIDVTESNPILGFAVRHAARKGGANLAVYYPSKTALKRLAKPFVTGTPEELYKSLDQLVDAVKGAANDQSAVAGSLKNAEKPVLVFNPYNEADAWYVQELKAALPALKLVPAKAKNNSQGVVDMGITSKGLKDALGKLKALVVFGENLAVRTGYTNVDLGKLEFLAVCDPFLTETAQKADVYVPVATFAEKNGSFTNLEGRVQIVNKAVDKGVVTDRDVVVALAKAAGGNLPCCVGSIRSTIKAENPLYASVDFNGGVVSYGKAVNGTFEKKTAVSGAGKFTLYPAALRLHSGSLTHQSPDLAKTYGEPMVEVSPADAAALGVATGDTVTLKAGGKNYSFKVTVDKLITNGCASLPEDFAATAEIFAAGRYQKVDLTK